MCYSSTASFGIAGVLLPVAAVSLFKASAVDRKWLALGAFPLAFAVQQTIEGAVWLGLDGDAPRTVALASRGFLFFSHFFWPAFVPFAVALSEPVVWRRLIAQGLAVLGVLFGLSIFVPAAVQWDWLSVAVSGGSLEYRTTLIYEGIVGRPTLRAVYAVVVLGALLLSSASGVRVFGGLIAASLLATTWLYPLVYISVWCFLAAILSVYLAIMFWLWARPSD